MQKKILTITDFQTKLLQSTTLVNKKINQLLTDKSNLASQLLNAMRYSSLSRGKRIRPFLLMSCAELFNIPKSQSIYTATALEFIHIYSLIHDDLPAMDDDDYRRGELTCHKKFDEATAILAGDALLTYAFEILASPKTHPDSEIRCQLITLISQTAGFKGMVGGQMLDLQSNKLNSTTSLDKQQIIQIQKLKTGRLFIAATQSAAILGKSNSLQQKALKKYSDYLGLAFQISDDLLDYNEKASTKSNDNANIVNIIGTDNAKKELDKLKEQAILGLKVFPNKKAKILEMLIELVVNRKK